MFPIDLEKLKMWEPLHDLVTSHSSTDPVILQALWVIGTALQNNPAAQDSVGPPPICNVAQAVDVGCSISH